MRAVAIATAIAIAVVAAVLKAEAAVGILTALAWCSDLEKLAASCELRQTCSCSPAGRLRCGWRPWWLVP
jgi:hypothetical protein